MFFESLRNYLSEGKNDGFLLMNEADFPPFLSVFLIILYRSAKSLPLHSYEKAKSLFFR